MTSAVFPGELGVMRREAVHGRADPIAEAPIRRDGRRPRAMTGLFADDALPRGPGQRFRLGSPAASWICILTFALVSCDSKDRKPLSDSSQTDSGPGATAVTLAPPPLGEFVVERDLDAGLLAELDVPEVRVIEQVLKDSVVPRLEFEGATFPEVIAAIQACSVEYSPEPSPERRGVSVILDRSPGIKQTNTTSLPDPFATKTVGDPALNDPFSSETDGSAQSATDKPEATISEVFVNRSVHDLFEAVTARFSCWFEVTPYAVRIYPNSVPKPVDAIVAFAVEEDFVANPGLEASAPSASDPFASEVKVDRETPRTRIMDALESAGVSFHGTSNLVYDPSSSRLIVRAPLEELKAVSRYLQWYSEQR
ncbi:MAG: hypothetical protein KDN18_09700 [Verrucomicrobiae bacterium]|nr:hypothetical protein [Verrucomicrobiae bacterium]